MYKYLLILFTINVLGQDLPSPKVFHGHETGKKVLFHYQVVDYVEAAAKAFPKNTKLFRFGKTTEGRDQVALVIGHEKYISKLEEIRTSHLKSVGLLAGTPTTEVPAIGYMSFSVHGNEIAGTTAASDFIYQLLNPGNSQSKAILENTIVIVDPALNPDGYDRYANWYNRVQNADPDLTPYAREHAEPWPGGRFLHYMFDPNRDWAWQVQQESQNRTAFYNQWMPHVHTDLHEMGPNDPYFFAPGAKPYHESITPFQRDFHEKLGEANKKYFDANKWLYYTKENYDFLYPSYGDSYPTYNGAIGMTYEQGGGGVGGIQYIRSSDKDTLTLTERAQHHFTAAFATLETLSKNADATRTEFKKYHENAAKNGVGTFKSYVFRYKGQEEKIDALTSLMDKMEVKYTYLDKSKKCDGFIYQSNANGTFEAQPNDLLISTFQAKGTLVKVLFEPKTALEDSNTYDITAWALPYAYGLEGLATKDKIDGSNLMKKNGEYITTTNADIYAYVIPLKSLNSARALAAISKKGIKVRYAEVPFEIEGQSFQRGSLIVPVSGNTEHADLRKTISDICQKNRINYFPASSGLVSKGFDFGSDYTPYIKTNQKVLIVAGAGVSATAFGDVWHYFEKQLGYPATVVEGDRIADVPLEEVDVIILPDGRYGKILDDKMHAKIKTWVQNGGKIIAMEGALNAFVGREGYGLKTKTTTMPEKNTKTENLGTFGDRVRGEISNQLPGAIFALKMDESHPLAFGIGPKYHAILRDTYELDFLKDGWNAGLTVPESHVSGFVGANAKKKLANTLIYGVENMGRGSVVYMADNPLFRGFWHNGKLLFANAVFLVK